MKNGEWIVVENSNFVWVCGFDIHARISYLYYNLQAKGSFKVKTPPALFLIKKFRQRGMIQQCKQKIIDLCEVEEVDHNK